MAKVSQKKESNNTAPIKEPSDIPKLAEQIAGKIEDFHKRLSTGKEPPSDYEIANRMENFKLQVHFCYVCEDFSTLADLLRYYMAENGRHLQDGYDKLLAQVQRLDELVYTTQNDQSVSGKWISWYAGLSCFAKELRNIAEIAREEFKAGKTPSDLIDLAKAVSKYHRSRAQFKRDIDDGTIKSYRKKPKGKHYISESEVDTQYLRKDSLA